VEVPYPLMAKLSLNHNRLVNSQRLAIWPQDSLALNNAGIHKPRPLEEHRIPPLHETDSSKPMPKPTTMFPELTVIAENHLLWRSKYGD
ncbi:hypothetical protein, partial [uncultured Sulfitobacter sp.]|uniref:hypothetical protein n=1 Tax=uncultured Sulfitobacter sp. TaxID=191468 RepID=UPI0025E1CF89